MLGIVTGIQYLLAKIVALAGYIGDLVKAVFVAFWDLITDAVVWCFDQFLGLAISILSVFDFSGLTAQAGAWAGLPGVLLEVLSAIGLSTAIGMIVTALGIRLMLQLVPFTRLGS